MKQKRERGADNHYWRRVPRIKTYLLRIPHTQACRYELRGDVCDYCHAAARHLAPGGVFALVFPISPPFQMQRVWTGAQEAGLKMIRHRPVVFKEGEAPILGLFLMCLKEHVPDDFREWTEPPLIIRKRTGSSPPVCRMREAREGAGGCVLRVGARHCLLTRLDGGGRVRVRVGVFCGLARAIACSLS